MGDIIDKEAMEGALAEVGSTGNYIMALHTNEWVKQSLYVDARQMGSIFRLMNHSCDPNCEVVRWQDGQLPCLIIRTLSDVNEGEELNYDYGYEVSAQGNGFACHCGKSDCRKWIGKVRVGVKRTVEEMSAE